MRVQKVAWLSFGVVVEGSPDHAELARQLWSGCPEHDGPPDRVYRVDARALSVLNDDHLSFVGKHVDELLPAVEGDLYRALRRGSAPASVVHAAALRRGAGHVLLVGPSGAGKTSTALELVRRGWRLATDELVLVHRAERAVAMRRTPQLKGRDGPGLPYSVPQLDGGVRHLRLIQLPAGAYAEPEGPLQSVVILDRAATGARRLTAAAAVAALWPCVDAAPDRLLPLVGAVPVWAVGAPCVGEVASLVEDVA